VNSTRLATKDAVLCQIMHNDGHGDADFLLLNKSAQSNLGKGPRRGAVAHIRRKVPIGYNAAPQFAPKSTETASGSDPPFCHNALDTGQTDRCTYVRTDR